MGNDIGVFHKYIAGKMKEKTDSINSTIQICDARHLLTQIYRIPTSLHHVFLSEMEQLKLIKRINKQKILVLYVGNDAYNEIKELSNEGMKQTEIAQRFGVSQKTISLILKK